MTKRIERGTGGPAAAPPVQDRPAEPGRPRRTGREQPVDRMYQVTGPKAVGGVLRGGTVTLCLTRPQEAALIEGGHVMPVPERPAVADDTKEG